MLNQTKRVDLFFACDDNYIPFLSVALSSIQKHMSPQNNYRAVILYANNINLDNQEKITLKYSKPNFEIIFRNIHSEIEHFSESLHTRDYYSKATYYRLLIPNLYPNIDKALYLDSDILVLDDIANLYNTNLEDNLVGAIHDGAVETIGPFQDYVVNTIGCKTQQDYFNAGVLLMNLEKMREIDFENKFLKLLSRVTFNVAQDQDYLNVICKDRVAKIDFKWDVMPFENLKQDLQDIKLIHYNLSSKPWQSKKQRQKPPILYKVPFSNQRIRSVTQKLDALSNKLWGISTN